MHVEASPALGRVANELDTAELPAGHGAYLFWERERTAAQVVRMPSDPAAYAAQLYRALHDLDGQGLQWIAVERLPNGAAWAAVQDRLDRATHY